MMTNIQAETDEQIGDSRLLFREYESWFGLNLCFQGFDSEVAELPGKYAEPDGRFLLAYSDDKLAGCIAMRKLEEGVCEMKRLFVRDGVSRSKIGLQLIEKLIDEARKEKYKTIRLDTFPPKMAKAVSLYQAHGFHPISPYYDNPYDGVLFYGTVAVRQHWRYIKAETLSISADASTRF